METVVQEIANQLGMAVDQAGQFIMEQLPGYAALQAMKLLVPMLILLGLIIFLYVIGKVAERRADKLRKMNESEDKNDWTDPERIETFEWGSDIAFLGAWIVIVILFIVCVINLSHIIGWLNYPEAMLIDQAIQAIS